MDKAIIDALSHFPVWLLMAVVIVFGVAITLLLRGVFADLKSQNEYILSSLDNIEMNQESTDWALFSTFEKHFPKNGTNFLQLKKDKKEELMSSRQLIYQKKVRGLKLMHTSEKKSA